MVPLVPFSWSLVYHYMKKLLLRFMYIKTRLTAKSLSPSHILFVQLFYGIFKNSSLHYSYIGICVLKFTDIVMFIDFQLLSWFVGLFINFYMQCI